MFSKEFLTVFFCFSLCQVSFAINNVTLIGGNYQLFWYQENEDNLCVKMIIDGSNCNSDCWVGFGLGEPTSGAMSGSDIVVAELRSGQVTVTDMNADREATPKVDISQDWSLSSFIDGSDFEAEVCRKLVTGDGEDRDIVAYTGSTIESMPVIVAFGSGAFGYHLNNRQTTRIPLLASEEEFTASQSAISHLHLDPSITTVVFNHTGPGLISRQMNFVDSDLDKIGEPYEVPAIETAYVDNYYNLSLIDPSLQVVAFEPFFTPETEKYVHHYVLKFNGVDVYAWAGDKSPFILPSDVGFPLTGVDSIILQYHYDNPSGDTGKFDDSGLRIYLTNVTRTHSAGLMQLGDGRIILENVGVPLGLSSIHFPCSPDCIQNELNVFGTMMHTHAKGAGIINTHTNSQGDDIADPLFARSEFYDYNLQGMFPVNFTVSPGDKLATTCFYDNNDQDMVFGLDSDQEMCIVFVMYYPAQPELEFCDFANDCPGGNQSDIKVPEFTAVDSVLSFRTFPVRPSESAAAKTREAFFTLIVATFFSLYQS